MTFQERRQRIDDALDEFDDYADEVGFGDETISSYVANRYPDIAYDDLYPILEKRRLIGLEVGR